jgi:hypothetical protein
MEILDTIKLLEKNFKEEKYISNINTFIEHIKKNKHLHDINFVLNLQKKLFILRNIYDDIDNENIEEKLNNLFLSIIQQ